MANDDSPYEMTEEDKIKSMKTNAYDYKSKIQTPENIGMRSEGSLDALGDNISGLIAYGKILTTGGGKALNNDLLGNSGVLGNKYFTSAGTKCKDIDNNSASVERSIYMNFSSCGNSGKKHVGLIPGIICNMTQLNPKEIYDTLKPKDSKNASDYDTCKAIRMETIDTSGQSDFQTKFVTIADIKKMPASFFPDGVKPDIPENFANYNESNINKILKPEIAKYSSDILTRTYFLCVTILLLYIFLKMLRK